MDPEFRFDTDDVEQPVQAPQAAWEFSGVAEDVHSEHARRNTTSVDQKIQAQLKSKQKLKENRQRWSGAARKLVENDEATAEQDTDLQTKSIGGSTAYANGSSKISKKRSGDEDSDLEEDERLPETGNWADEEEEDERAGEDGHENGEGQGTSEKRLTAKRGRDVIEDSDSEEEEASEKKKKPKLPRVRVEDIGQSRKGVKGQPDDGFFTLPEGTSFTAKSFGELNISRPLIRACEALGYTRPTPIQAACVPLALTGRDICGSAVTGSGKTAAFALPVLERLLYRPRRVAATRVLVLTPTRELAVQVHSMIAKLAQFTDISTCLVVGGLSQKAQEGALRKRPDVVVATPGRLIDHLHNTQSVGLEDLSILILDEADRLLEMGFTQEVHEVVRMCPRGRQTLLFSATMTAEVAELIQLSLNAPIRLSADPLTMRPATLVEEVIKVRPQDENNKEALLLALATRSFASKTIIFSATKTEAHRLKILFGLTGLKAAELHGNLTQAMRLDALESFRTQAVDFLIATDVAARGLDITGVETVINFDCPRDITSYVHRVGRTARAGRRGCAVTMVTERDRQLLKAMAKRADSRLKSRVVAPASVAKWRAKIEEQEPMIAEIGREEREERVLRKAEMEANKVQNMLEHEAEIYSRPAKLWFQTGRQKKELAEAAKEKKFGKENAAGEGKVKMTEEEAAELKRKEKLRRDREKNLPRKKRRRLEEMKRMEEEDEEGEGEGDDGASGEEDDDGGEEADNGHKRKRSGAAGGRGKQKKGEQPGKGSASKHEKGKKPGSTGEGSTVAETAYRKAKAAKAAARAREAGKIPPQRGPGTGAKKGKGNKGKPGGERSMGRKREMEELFRGDKGGGGGEGKRKGAGAKKIRTAPKRAFKSKARYKRRK